MGRTKQRQHANRPKPSTDPLFDSSEGSIKGVRGYNAQDLDLNGQDLFELQQDAIGLEDATQAGDSDDEDVFKSNEVLPLNVKRSRASSESEEELLDEEQQSAQPARKRSRVPQEHQPVQARPGLSSRFERPPPVNSTSSASESSGSASDDESDEEDQGWGNAYHVSRREIEEGPYVPKQRNGKKRNKDLDELELDPDKAELAEALRLQRIQRASLDGDDFGAVSALATPTDVESKPVSDVQTAFDTREAAIAYLLQSNPLLLSLLTDFTDQTQHSHALESLLKTLSPASPLRALQTLHLQVVQTYLAVCAFWFKLLLEGKHEHELGQSVFKRLVGLREGMQGLQDAGLDIDEANGQDGEDVDFDAIDGLDEEDSQEYDMDEMIEDDDHLHELVQQRDLLKALEREGLSREDLEAARAGTDSDEAEGTVEAEKPEKKKRKKRGKRKGKQMQVDDAQPSSLLLSRPQSRDDYLEPAALSSADADAKKATKHSLRFHTSQIASTANRRSTAAEARRQGGDMDVPYVSKEQLRREAQRKAAARQEKELRARGQMPDQQSDDGEGQTPDEGDDGYYDLIQTSKKAAKQGKKDAYDEQKMADRAALSMEESTSGPRAISRAILANKGLTPRRPKANRNPRVKKRMNYEKAKKRVGSQKRVFNSEKAEAGRKAGGYEGEKSGINRRAVKSVKL